MIEAIDQQCRPGYQVWCTCCGRAEVVTTILPDEIWNAIKGEDYALCPVCIDLRMIEKGLTCEPEFRFMGRALRSGPQSPAAERSMHRWMPLIRN